MSWILITPQGTVLRIDTKDIRPIGRATQEVLPLNEIDAQGGTEADIGPEPVA